MSSKIKQARKRQSQKMHLIRLDLKRSEILKKELRTRLKKRFRRKLNSLREKSPKTLRLRK